MNRAHYLKLRKLLDVEDNRPLYSFSENKLYASPKMLSGGPQTRSCAGGSTGSTRTGRSRSLLDYKSVSTDKGPGTARSCLSGSASITEGWNQGPRYGRKQYSDKRGPHTARSWRPYDSMVELTAYTPRNGVVRFLENGSPRERDLKAEKRLKVKDLLLPSETEKPLKVEDILLSEDGIIKGGDVGGNAVVNGETQKGSRVEDEICCLPPERTPRRKEEVFYTPRPPTKPCPTHWPRVRAATANTLRRQQPGGTIREKPRTAPARSTPRIAPAARSTPRIAPAADTGGAGGAGGGGGGATLFLGGNQQPSPRAPAARSTPRTAASAGGPRRKYFQSGQMRVQTHTGHLFKNGCTYAIPFHIPGHENRRPDGQNKNKYSQEDNKIRLQTEYISRFRSLRTCFAAMDDKPLEKYTPGALRSRLQVRGKPVVRRKNDDSFQFGFQSIPAGYTRPFATSHQCEYKGLSKDYQTNPGVLGQLTKFRRRTNNF